MSKKKENKKNLDFYDNEEIMEQKQYEQNPLSQVLKKEKIDLVRILAYNSRNCECKYFYYLEKHFIQGYSLREIAKAEGIYHELVRSRMEQALRYLKREVVRYNLKQDTPE